MKKLNLTIGIVIASVLFFTACSTQDNTPTTPSPVTLNTPTVSYNKGTISWDEIANADKYEISIDNQIYITYQNKYELNVGYNSESHDVKVKAISENNNFINSAFSQIKSFDTYKLKNTEILSSKFNEDKTQKDINLQYFYENDESIYYSAYLNGQHLGNYTSNTLLIKKDMVNVGSNTIELITRSNDPNICDSDKTSFSVYKNADYENLRVEGGKVLYDQDGEVCEYDSTNIPTNKFSHLIQNNKIAGFPSDGIMLDAQKLYLQVKDCEYYSEHSIYYGYHFRIVLRVSAPFLDNLELSYPGYLWNNIYHFEKPEIIHGEYDDICIFDFIAEEGSYSGYIELTAHSDGRISSNTLEYKLPKSQNFPE